MKEIDAKTKWCPHTRMVFGYDKGTTQPFNRFATEPGDEMEAMQKAMNGTNGTKCIGSDCMLWESYQTRETKRQEMLPAGEGWIKSDDLWFRYVDTDSGDCGLKTKELQCNV